MTSSADAARDVPTNRPTGTAGATVCGTMSTSSVPANVVVRCVRPSTSRRRARSGPVRIRPRRAVGTRYAALAAWPGAELGQLHRRSTVVADRLPQLEVRRRLSAEVGQLDVDASRLADRHHRRADDAPDVERRQPALHRDDGDEQRNDDADADDVQLDQAEDPPDREARGGGDNCCPAVPRDHLSTGGYGHGADDFADDRDAGDTPRHRIGPQHDPVRQHRLGDGLDVVGRRVLAALAGGPSARGS